MERTFIPTLTMGWVVLCLLPETDRTSRKSSSGAEEVLALDAQFQPIKSLLAWCIYQTDIAKRHLLLPDMIEAARRIIKLVE